MKMPSSLFVTITLLAIGLIPSVSKSDAETRFIGCRSDALVPTLESTNLPSVKGWKIETLKRGHSVMCSARQDEENGQKMTVLADTGKYRGGVWFLGVSSRNQNLEPGVQETIGWIILDGMHVVSGKVFATGSWVGGKQTESSVRFDFPTIDNFVKDIKSAHVVEVQAPGTNPLKLEGLSVVMDALESCQQQASSHEFWENAKHVCN